jgi:hypothetical protein
MSLKEKLLKKTEHSQSSNYGEGFFDCASTTLKDFNEAVSQYLDCRDNPEKYPEFVKQFYTKYDIMFKDATYEHKLVWLQEYIPSKANWRDFLFNHFFGDGK